MEPKYAPRPNSGLKLSDIFSINMPRPFLNSSYHTIPWQQVLCFNFVSINTSLNGCKRFEIACPRVYQVPQFYQSLLCFQVVQAVSHEFADFMYTRSRQDPGKKKFMLHSARLNLNFCHWSCYLSFFLVPYLT